MAKGTTANSYGLGPDLKINEVGMDGTLKVKYIGRFEMKWRTPGAAYQIGDTVFDNTFIVTCIKAGTTDASNKWGPVEDAAWSTDDTWQDGSVTWKKVTHTASDGVWRSDQTEYEVGTVLILDGSVSGTVKVYQTVGVEGDSVPLGPSSSDTPNPGPSDSGNTGDAGNTGNTGNTDTSGVIKPPSQSNAGNPETVYDEGAKKSNKEIIAGLPTPQTVEEQFLYAWACTLAGVSYQTPFQKPIYRKEQLLKGLWQIVQNQMVTPTTIWKGSVTTDSLQDGSVSSGKLSDGSVTRDKISDASVTQDKISDGSVTDKKLTDGAVTTDKLADEAVTSEKIADGSVTGTKIAENTIDASKLAKSVAGLLLAVGESGILQQKTVSGITASGDALTAAVVADKVNELIEMLKAAKVMK